MSRLLRLPLLRALVPRVTAPLLPTSTLRAAPLTNAVRSSNSRLFQHFPARLSSSPPPDQPYPTLPADATLSQRLKHLIKSYGWYALGLYIVIGTIDFGIAFAAINLVGADHVSHFASTIREAVTGFVHSKPPEPGRDEIDSPNGHGHEGLYAMIVLAYTVHKTLFLPIRVGLTAGLTPKLVHWLRTRGWAGGAGTRRAAEEMRDRFRRRKEERD